MINRVSLEPLKQAFSLDTTILVPNNRLREALISSFAAAQNKHAFYTPNIISIDVWIRSIWEHFANLGLLPFATRLPISSSEELFLWITIIENTSAKTPLLNPEDTARSVSHAYQLLRQWKLEEDHLDDILNYRTLPDIAAFIDWKAEFEAQCDKNHLVSLADCLTLINAYFDTCEHSNLEGRFCLLGFLAPPPLYAELFDRLGRLHDVEIIEPSHCKSPQVGTHFTFDSWTAELDTVCQWARDRLLESPESHIGLIGEFNEMQLRDIKQRIKRELNPHALLNFERETWEINSSQTGSNLSQEPIVHDALLAISLIREQQTGEDLCRVIHSPFIVIEEENARSRVELERVIRNQLTARCRMSDFLYFAGETQKDHHCPQLYRALGNARELKRRHAKLTSSANWVQLFEKVLRELGWPGLDLTNHQVQVLKRWQDTLEQFSALSTVTGKLDLNAALRCLRFLCRSTQAQRYFSYRANISLYKPEEAVGLEFDHLWLVNLNDQAWPLDSTPSPFLPYKLQFEKNMPGSHGSAQYARAAATFTALSRSVRQTLMSSHHNLDDGQKIRPSSFVKDFIQECPKPSPTVSLQSIYGHHYYGKQLIVNNPDDSQVAISPLPQAVGGHQVLSDQSSCPFKAFAKHRLNVSPLTKFELGLSAAVRGNALHHALEYIFSQLGTKDSLHALSQDELNTLCYHAADLAVGYLRRVKKTLMTPTFLRIEKNRTATLLIKFLTDFNGEAGRLNFAVEEREKKHHWTYDELQFSFRIDRVDKLANEELAIIDYKTGKSFPSSGSWLSDRPEDLQIPFYFTAMSSLQDNPVGAISLVNINPAKIEYKGFSSQGNFHTRIKASSEHSRTKKSWTELSDIFLSQTARFAREFKLGLVAVNPVNTRTTCRYCGLQGLCRIDELTKAEHIESSDIIADDLYD